MEQTNELAIFDYSGIDTDTASFLKEKANKIADISIKSIMAVGKELKAAQERLANHDKTKGVFVKWVQSLGISDDTAYNYINNYSFVSKQFGNIEAAKQFLMLPQKLQYEVSKPSASEELQKAVLDGDITSYKEYKELEEKLRTTVDQLNEEKDKEHKARLKAEKEVSDKENELKSLNIQLEEAKKSGDSSKVVNLENQILALENDKKTLDAEIISLRKQLKDKPIEATATKEVIPDSIQELIYNNVQDMLTKLEYMDSAEIKIYAANAPSEAINLISNCINKLGNLLDAVKAVD